MRSVSIRKRGGPVALVICVGLGAWVLAALGSATGPTPPHVAITTPVPATTLPAGGAGMRVAIQPESGDFELPTPEQAKAFDAGMQPHGRGDLVVRTRPDGGQYVDVRGRFLNYSVARVGADGKPSQACLDRPRAVDQFLHGDAAAVPSAGPEVQ